MKRILVTILKFKVHIVFYTSKNDKYITKINNYSVQMCKDCELQYFATLIQTYK